MHDFYLAEYIENLREKLSYIESELKYKLTLLKKIKERREGYQHIGNLDKKIEMTLREPKTPEELTIAERSRYIYLIEFPITRLKTELTELKNLFEPLNPSEISIDLIWKIQEKYIYCSDILGRLENELGYISLAINQWISDYSLYQNIHYQPSATEISGSEVVLEAINAVLYNYTELIFGQNWIKEIGWFPIAAVGMRDYAMDINTYITTCPFSDQFRVRFWSAFAHEIQHEKNYLVFTYLSEKNKSELNLERLEKIQEKDRYEYETNKLIKEYAERKLKMLLKNSIEKICRLRTKIRDKCVEILYNDDAEDADETQLEKYMSQCYQYIDEIISDFSATLLSGPANFFATTSMGFFADNESTPYHPAGVIRLYYIYKILKKEGIWKYLNLPEFDIPYLNEDIESFRKFIDECFDELCLLTKSLIACNEEEYFNKDMIEKTVEITEKIKEGSNILEILKKEGIEPRILINVGWLKRLDTFNKMDKISDKISLDTVAKINRYNELNSVGLKLYDKFVTYLSYWWKRKFETIERGD